MKKDRVSPAVRYHRTASGEVKPCTASVRACPYRQHFDSIEEARDRRMRIAQRIDAAREIVHFATTIGEGVKAKSEYVRNQKSLRETSEEARASFFNNGHRPCSPLGELAVNLPDGRRITLKRESYDLSVTSSDTVGSRYYVRYWNSPTQFSYDAMTLNTPIDYRSLESKLQGFFAESSDNLATKGKTEDLKPYYEKTMQAIAEIEIMARGADNASSSLGIDLFDKSKPGKLILSTSYSNSALQPYDITDSLKVHAAHDKHLSEIELSFSDVSSRDGKSKWVVNRLPDGDWYVGVNSRAGVLSSPVYSIEEASVRIRGILEKHYTPAEEIEKQVRFIEHVMNEVDPAIRSYRQAVKARLEGSKDSLQAASASTKVDDSNSGGFAKKIMGMFG